MRTSGVNDEVASSAFEKAVVSVGAILKRQWPVSALPFFSGQTPPRMRARRLTVQADQLRWVNLVPSPSDGEDGWRLFAPG